LRDCGGCLLERPAQPRLRFARLGGLALADGDARGPSDGVSRHLRRGDGRLRARDRRDDDRAHGDGEHADPGLEPLQRVPHALREHRDRDPRGTGGRDALPDAVPRGPPPLHAHLRGQHRGGARPSAPPPEVLLAMKSVRNRPSDLPGRALTWLTGGTLAWSLLLIAGLLTLLAIHGGSAFWPRPLWLVTLKDGTKLLGDVEREEDARIQLRVANRDLTGADFRWVDKSDIAARMQP